MTAVEVFEPGGAVQRLGATAGQIARVRGLDGARIGDWLGCRPAATTAAAALPEPDFETRVVACDPAQQGEVHQALAELADIDPLIALRPERGAARIRIYGEVHPEVLADTLVAEYGIDVDFRDTGVVCIERPSGTGRAALRRGEPGHLYNSDYPPAGPRVTEVRRTAVLVVREALRRAGTAVCEPIDRFVLEAPTDELPAVLALLGRHGAVPETVQITGPIAVVTGILRGAEVSTVRTGLHSAAHGEGLLESAPDHYQPVRTTGRRQQ